MDGPLANVPLWVVKMRAAAAFDTVLPAVAVVGNMADRAVVAAVAVAEHKGTPVDITAIPVWVDPAFAHKWKGLEPPHSQLRLQLVNLQRLAHPQRLLVAGQHNTLAGPDTCGPSAAIVAVVLDAVGEAPVVSNPCRRNGP